MMKKLTLIVASAAVAGLALTGCSGNASDQPPIPSSAATDTNGNNAQLVIPSDLAGKDAQLADDELRKVGFVNIKYGSQGTTVAVDPAHLADWNVAAVEPAGGSPAQSNDNIVVTVVKK